LVIIASVSTKEVMPKNMGLNWQKLPKITNSEKKRGE
jgi:hypothetical protein